MSTVTASDYVPLGHAARFLPPGIRVTGATLRRWLSVGVDGRRLAGRRVGGRWYVRPADVEAFLADPGNIEVPSNE